MATMTDKTAENTSDVTERVEPVFFLNNDVDQTQGNYEICTAMSEFVSSKKAVDAAQRIGGAWRIYLLNNLDRALLLSSGISLRGDSHNIKR